MSFIQQDSEFGWAERLGIILVFLAGILLGAYVF